MTQLPAQLPATPEQAERLQELFEQWDAQLKSFKKYPALTRDTAKQLNGSRRILENYRRVLKADLGAGIAKVPAGELFRAISTAEASLKQLEGLEAILSASSATS